MHFTNFVIHAGIKKNALCGGGFARINVGRNTDVSIALDRSLACHGQPLGESIEKQKTLRHL
jgi:hypothetical protein